MSLDVVESHKFEGFTFALLREDEWHWHALKMEKCDSSTGDSFSLFLNCGDADKFESLGVFLIRAANEIRKYNKEHSH